jgi:hypothetical protein
VSSGRTEKGVAKRKEGATPVAGAIFGADPMVTEKGRCVKVFVNSGLFLLLLLLLLLLLSLGGKLDRKSKAGVRAGEVPSWAGS